jgi:hypothetical protein
MDYLVQAAVIGGGATALLDLWTLARQRITGTPVPDYGLVGRWLAWMPRGRFRHEAIARVAPVRGEAAVGWIAHYLIGITFALALLATWGLEWARQPTLGPALLVGLGTVAAPFLLMQPGMGAGFFASRTPDPRAARVRSLMVHAVFGLSLYLAALAAQLISHTWR